MADTNRLAAGLAWRAEALYNRLPRSGRVWIENRRQDRLVQRGHTSFDRARLIHTYTEAIALLRERQPGGVLGDYLEFGVYHGTSLSCMYAAREQLGLGTMRLFGFDSFDGLPDSASEEDDALWWPGQFRSSIELTRATLRQWDVPDDAATLIPGWFSDSCTPETRARLGLEKTSVIMVDCDLYSSARDALAFCGPLICTQAVLVFDDYNAGSLAEKQMGEKRAFEEFLDANPDLHAEEIEGLNYKNKVDPQLFLVTRVGGR